MTSGLFGEQENAGKLVGKSGLTLMIYPFHDQDNVGGVGVLM